MRPPSGRRRRRRPQGYGQGALLRESSFRLGCRIASSLCMDRDRGRVNYVAASSISTRRLGKILQKNFLSVVDLFAGCGGFGLGLEEAGFTPIFVNELNDDARSTYLVNRRDRYAHFREGMDESRWLNPFSSSDARKMTRKSYLDDLESRFESTFGIKHGEIDLIVGGPPCQGFSGIGHRRSYSVDKHDIPSNHLFKDMASIIRHLRPKAFVFENVRGLLTARWTPEGEPGEIWWAVKRAFARIGNYRIASQLLHAKDYGVAQNRPRVMLVGIRDDIAGAATRVDCIDEIDDTAIGLGFLPRPIGGAPDLMDLLGDLIDPEYTNGGQTAVYPKGPSADIQYLLRKKLSGEVAELGAPLTDHEYSKHSDHVKAKFQAMINGDHYVGTKKFAQRLLPPIWGAKGPMITATSLPDDYVHFKQARTLTVREWARLQGFPDWYQFRGKRTTGGIRRAGNPQEGIHFRELPKYTQIGNAVPVPLAREIGKNLAGILLAKR